MENSKILSLIPKISEIAKKNNWQTEYDKELDSFYWTKPKLSKTAKLVQFIDEFSLYITPSGQIEGLFIEYAKFNFSDHNKKFKPLFNAMTQKINGQIYTISEDKEKRVEHLLESMADKVAKETLGVITQKKLNIESMLSI